MARLAQLLTLLPTIFTFIAVILINVGGVNPGSPTSSSREKNSDFSLVNVRILTTRTYPSSLGFQKLTSSYNLSGITQSPRHSRTPPTTTTSISTVSAPALGGLNPVLSQNYAAILALSNSKMEDSSLPPMLLFTISIHSDSATYISTSPLRFISWLPLRQYCWWLWGCTMERRPGAEEYRDYLL